MVKGFISDEMNIEVINLETQNITFRENAIYNMGKNRKSKKDKCKNAEVWTEEQYEEYMKAIYGMEFIAGLTENGVPYGTFIDEDEEDDELIIRDISTDYDDELPF